ncbi:ATP dependent DNA ligase domain-containing protein [Cercophora newfieldiana]|uniref:DNA ligase n=1 Tax=Cercophora newfieldiana TaxID=92897 RepID=A0AA39Y7G7_9PEZI|nr:ATP dependent DNA ligase domain-containing protein [Cercophora newfieldiana]
MSKVKRPKSPDPDAIEEDEKQYSSGPLNLDELEEHFPNRPRNHSRTFRFSELFKSLFNPLIECKPTPSGVASTARRHIIERFMSRWRSDVGNDFYPALRLILPDKDRDRGTYGLKESTIGKLLVKVMKIDKNSEDGYGLTHWKLPAGGGHGAGRGSAGDFAGRCFEVVGKRAMRVSPGELTIGEVNVLLDRLAAASGEKEQMVVWEEFYQGMNAEEMMWLVRIVLKDMKVGATERTFLGLLHPDAEALFNVSSSLRRVCWELWDPEVRLEQQETGVSLMSIFQPQLAQFQPVGASFAKLVVNLGVTEEQPVFWIEEKLDGERMQMHMVEDDSVAGGFRFAFWSRKAKDYTYLYGEGLEDDKSALTRHLKKAFDPQVRNLILDGEMITWDPEVDKIVPFGTLKTAALEQQKNPFQTGPRPLFRVFDILLLNDFSLTGYVLHERRKVLEKVVLGEPRRLEIHPYEAATSPDAIEPQLRTVVAEASEGLVLKNPFSTYKLNSRNNDWIKVKPEYMSEFGESFDCVIVGGYYGSGRRGGTLSSFLCAVRVGQNFVQAGVSPEKCLSLFKVGGGFKAEDYAQIKHLTEGKWYDWDAANPPSEFIELGGGERLQCERPDVWIRPRDSVVISAKGSSITPSDQFALGWTLRFPRFRKLRLDKDTGMDADEFEAIRCKVNQEEKDRKAMEYENRKRKPATKRAKHELVIVGTDPNAPAEFEARAPRTRELFKGLDFLVLTEAVRPVKTTKALSEHPKPVKLSKPALELLIKENGGRIHQKIDKGIPIIVVADKNVVRVASLKKAGDVDIVRPKWLFDCLEQQQGGEAGYLLPFEEGHMFFATEPTQQVVEGNTDCYGDSYARGMVDVRELRAIFESMDIPRGSSHFDAGQFLNQLEEHGRGIEGPKGLLFRRCRVYFALGEGVSGLEAVRLGNYINFGRGEVADHLYDEDTTHVVVVAKDARQAREVAAGIRFEISTRNMPPRVVTQKWVESCWEEGTLLDEEAYVPV